MYGPKIIKKIMSNKVVSDDIVIHLKLAEQKCMTKKQVTSHHRSMYVFSATLMNKL